MPNRTLSAIRLQAAIVRSLVDEVDRTLPAERARAASLELADELTRLSAMIRESAVAVREATDLVTSEDAAANGR